MVTIVSKVVTMVTIVSIAPSDWYVLSLPAYYLSPQNESRTIIRALEHIATPSYSVPTTSHFVHDYNFVDYD